MSWSLQLTVQDTAIFWESILKIITFFATFLCPTLDLAVKSSKPFMLIGPKGTGKTSYMKNRVFQEINEEKEEAVIINFTPKITQKDIYEKIVTKLNKIKRGLYGPSNEKKCILFIDNFGLPLPDEHGDQPATEIIHQLMDHKFMYEPDNFNKVQLKNTTIISCITTAFGLNQKLSARTLRHFHAVSTTPAIDDSINKIFSTKFNVFFKTRGFQPEAAGVIGPIIQSSILIYNTMKDNLLPVPSKSHYIFDLTDIAKLVDGCVMLPKELSDNKKMYTRIWVHECLRVFNDRLISSKDTGILFEKIKHCVKTVFRENFDSAFEHLGKVDGFVTEYNLRNLTFGDFIEVEEKKCYQEIISFDEFSKQGQQIVDEYVKANPQYQTEFMFFKYTMENVCKICRVFSQPGGNIILLGEGGTGRELSARIASTLKHAIFYKAPVSKNFTFKQWREQIKRLLRETGGEGKCCIFFLTKEVLSNEKFLQDINTLLTNGEIEDIFTSEEKHVITEQMHLYVKTNKLEAKELSPSELYSKFITRCMTNFHMVFKLQSDDDQFRNLIRIYPEFLNKSVLCYFTEWPDDALQKAADMIFEDLPVSRDQRKIITNFSKEFYFSAKERSRKINEISGHKISLSPSSYISFIKFFSQIYQTKHAEVSQMKKTYEGAISKYENIEKEIEDLETDLADLKSQMDQLDEEHVLLQEKIDKEAGQLEIVMKDLKEEEGRVAVEQGKLDEIQENVDKEFRPVLKKIEECVSAIKAFSATDFQQPLSIKKPSSALKKTIGSVALLLGLQPEMIPDPSSKKKDAELVPDYWGPGKKMLKEKDNTVLSEQIATFDQTAIADEVIETLKKDFPESALDPVAVAKTSPIGEALCKWVRAIDEYTNIDRDVQDKKDHLKQAKEEFEEFKLTYKDKKRIVEDQEDLLNSLKQQQQENKEKKKEICDESDFGKLKKERGTDIVRIFELEKQWWEEERDKQTYYLECILGDLLLITAMICFLPSFTETEREEAVVEFSEKLIEKEVKLSDNDTRTSLFLSKMKMKQWEQFGLPSHQFYIMNGLLLTICTRWPLIIDPEQQATNWLKNMEESVYMIDADDSNLVTQLSANVQQGTVTLIYNIEETLDANLDNLIQKKFYLKDNVTHVVIGEKEIPYNPSFKMYLTSKKEEINFPSRIQSHLTVINFIPVTAGLYDHLLRIVVSKERGDLRQKREAAMKQYCEATISLEENRNRVLNILLQTEGNILENETAVDNLKTCQSNITEHLKKIEKVMGHQAKIYEAEVDYGPIAKHATVLYQTIRKLRNLNHMYRYSLQWFSFLYNYSIENSNKSKVIQKRLRYLSDHLTFNSFLQVSRSIYSKDRRAFSFMLCIDLMIFKEKLNMQDFEILLDEVENLNSSTENPSPDWLSPKTWSYISSLDKLDEYSGIAEDFKTHNDNWKMIFDAKEPDDLPLHEPWHSRLSKFHRLIVIKILRPDKMTELLDTFISEHLGYKFVEPLTFDLGRILADATPRSPMIFLLDPAKDPLRMVKKLKQERDEQAIGGSLSIICLSADVEETLMKQVDVAIKEGNWVYITNCHLSSRCGPVLDKIVVKLNTCQDINANFRLWLTTLPNNMMSSSVLGNSIKLAIEPSSLLRDQILDHFTTSLIANPDYYNSFPTKAANFTKLIYSIVFLICHSNGRHFYGTDGWSSKFHLSATDLEISLGFLSIIMKNHDGISFPSLHFLLNECNIENRLKDVQDRKLFEITLGQVCNESLLVINRYKFSASSEFFAPNKILHADFVSFIKEMPPEQNFEAFNISENSDFLRQEAEAKNLVNTFQKSINRSRGEDDVNSIEKCKKIQEQLPEEVEIPETLSQKHSTFFIKEQLEANNKLISMIKIQVKSLLEQLEGKQTLDISSEEFLFNVDDYKVPDCWIDSLDFSTRHIEKYLQRMNEYCSYYREMVLEDNIFWIPAIRKPEKLLNALLFEFCASQNYFKEEVEILASMHTEKPDFNTENSFLLTGVTLVSANIDQETKSMIPSHHKQHHEEVPFVKVEFRMKENIEDKKANFYSCPVYETSSRFVSNRICMIFVIQSNISGFTMMETLHFVSIYHSSQTAILKFWLNMVLQHLLRCRIFNPPYMFHIGLQVQSLCICKTCI